MPWYGDGLIVKEEGGPLSKRMDGLGSAPVGADRLRDTGVGLSVAGSPGRGG